MLDNAVRENWLTRIGGLRDGFLVLATVTYGTGYLVWSLQAWRLGLGLLPALDAQYFVAGIVPVLVAIGAFYAFRLANDWLYRLLIWLYAEPKTPSRTAIRAAVYVLSVVPIVLLMAADFGGFLKQILPWQGVFPVAIVALFIGSLLTPFSAKELDSKRTRLYRLFQLGNVIIGGAVIAVIYFIGSVYPYIPQELGGLRPRCAYIDLHKDLLSPFTLSALVSNAEASPSPVMRSKRLDILYASSDVVMIGADDRVYALDRQTIETISSCEERK